MFTWLMIGGGVIVLLVATPLVVGLLLPPEFSASASRSFRQPPERVWAALLDYRRTPFSASMCRGVDALPDENGLPAWRENLGSSRVKITTLEAAAPRRLVRLAADEVVPMKMRCEYALEPTAEGCVLTVTANGTIESGTWHVPFFRFMIRVFGGARAGQEAYLNAIGAAVGE